MKNHEDVPAIVEGLKKLYPERFCSLQYPESYELLFSVRLAAQYTGERVNMITLALFVRFPTLKSLAQIDPVEVETYIHFTGFSRVRARDIVTVSRMLVEQHSGRMSDTTERLLKLPNVGRKAANPILDDVYHTPGVVVTDTHCIRATGRLGLTGGTKDPAKVEEQLRSTLPSEKSNDFYHRVVLHGRAVYMAHKPDRPNCTLRPWCDFYTRS